MNKLNEKKIELRRKVEKQLEDKVIEKIAEALIFVAKEIYQKELENKSNNFMPSRNFGSAFFNSKSYGYKNSRNRICATESK